MIANEMQVLPAAAVDCDCEVTVSCNISTECNVKGSAPLKDISTCLAGVPTHEQVWTTDRPEACILLWLEGQCSGLRQEAVCCGKSAQIVQDTNTTHVINAVSSMLCPQLMLTLTAQS